MSEIRIATLGQVDAGKSTLLGILTNNHDNDRITFLDDGRGLARSKIFKFKHEMESGRTSSITNCYVKNNLNTIAFVDLAGHEKYLPTTIAGLSGSSIDYAMIVIGANTQTIPRTTKEHILLALSLNIPMIFIISKIDMPDQQVTENTIESIRKIMFTKSAKRKSLYNISEPNDLESVVDMFTMNNSSVCPLFKISNTTGEGIINLKQFLNKLPTIKSWNKDGSTLFVIEEPFNVPGIGLVVHGILKRGVINKNDSFYIGPFNGIFKKVTVKNIHNNFREDISKLEAGTSGCLWIKTTNTKEKLYKSNIKRGMVIIDEEKCISEFQADIMILHHPTTVKPNYQPIIHCGSIKQSAKIFDIKDYNNTNISIECLRSGDKAKVMFRFMFHPEYLEKNSIVVFREGKTKGYGKISEIIPLINK